MARSLWLGLNITFQCNRHCPHCYVPHFTDDTTSVMSDETLDRIIELCGKHVEKYGHPRFANMCALGGEPMLYPKKIQRAIEGIGKYFEHLTPRIDTNGDYLPVDFLEWCKNYKAEIQIGVNDTPISDLDRMFHLIATIGTKLRPFVVLTNHNLYRLDDIVDVVWKYTDTMLIKQELRVVDKAYIDLYERSVVGALERMLAKDIIFNPENFWEVISLNDPNHFRYGCGRIICIVDPDGDVRWCLSASKDDRGVVGNIWDEDFDWYLTMKCHDHPVFEPYEIEECKDCEYSHVCGGGCPMQKMVVYGTSNRPTDFCKANKRIIPLVLEMQRRYESKCGIR